MEHEESDAENNPSGNCEGNPIPEVTVEGRKRFRISITIEPIVFGLFLADTLSDAVIQNLVLMRTCIVHFHYNQSICNRLTHPTGNSSELAEEIQPYSAVILTAMNFITKFFPAFLSLFVGPWSDHYGRKLILVLPAIGYFFQYLLLIGFLYLPHLGPEYGLLAVLPVAFTGGFTNFVTGVYSYISDISKEENRSFRLSLIESVMMLSVYIGLLSSSYILKAGGLHGYVLIYGISSCLVLITAIPTYFFVPESVQITERSRGLSKIFDFGLLCEMFRVCFKKRESHKRAVIFIVITTLTIIIGIGTGETNVMYLYTKLRFGWDVHEFTIWASVTLASSFIGILVVSAILTKCLKVPDAVAAIISYAFRSVGAFYLGFVPPEAPHLMYYNAFFTLFSGLCGPVGRAILSKSVPKEDLGKVFALLGSTEAIFPLATGPLFTILYNSTIHTAPNAFLFVAGGFFVFCVVCYVIVYFLEKRYRGQEHERLHDESINW